MEHLVADRDWTVEVFTTCAASAVTWEDWYPPGTVTLGGVTVNRFRSQSGRDAQYLHVLPRLRTDAGGFSDAEAAEYLRLVGPVCPDAIDAAESSDCDLISVSPYLYWPAVATVSRMGRRVLFDPSTHDEPELYLPPMSRMYTSVGGIAYKTFAERALVERTYQVGHLPSAVVGSGVDVGEGDPAEARAALGLDAGEPFVLCLGKVERAKGSDSLAAMWSMYRERRGGDVPKLVFIGPASADPPARPGILYAGRQPDLVKWGALAACSMLILPSAMEAFSLVLLEAWLCGRPVIVNSRCAATVEHCRRSGGGVWFEAFGDLEVAVDRLLGSPSLANSLGARGRAYVRDVFSWEHLLDRYELLAERVASR
jgi:glycosyltransferase involved in cell wall biosynthesis